MNFIDFLVDLLVWVAFLYATAKFLSYCVHRYLDNSIEELDAELQELKRMIKYVKVEQHGDMIYLFDNDTDAFIVQGRTAEDFQNHIASDTVFKIVGGDDAAIKKLKEMFPARTVP